MNKECSICKTTKLYSEFYFYKNKYYSYCKQCCSDRASKYYKYNSEEIRKRTSDWKKNNRDKKLKNDREYRAKNPDANKIYRANNKLRFKGYYIKKQYNISLSDYEKMQFDQDNKCMICNEVQNQYTMHIDHCHKTNKIRALLCHFCNTGLGLFRDNQNSLSKAINYLEKFK